MVLIGAVTALEIADAQVAAPGMGVELNKR